MATVSQKEIALRRNFDGGLGQFFGALQNPDPILRKTGYGISVYKDIKYDAHVSACLSSRRAGLLSLEWEIDRGKSKTRQAKFIEDIFEHMNVQSMLSGMQTAALFGYSVAEIIWEKRGSQVVPADIKQKPQEWFGFDDENNLVMFTSGNVTGQRVPDMKFILTTNDATYDNPFGVACLAPCFWPYTFKRGGMKFWAVFTEKYGMPHLIGKYPAGFDKTKIDDMLANLNKMVQDAIAVIPAGAEIEILDVNKTASSDIYSNLLAFCNAEISKAILGQTLTTEVGQTGGAYAASKSHELIREDIIDSDRRMVEAAVNTVIRWIVDVNFGRQSVYPTFCMFQEQDVDKTLAERDELLARTGQIRFTAAHFKRRYGLDDDEFEIVEKAVPPKPQTAQSGEPTDPVFAERVTPDDPGWLDAVEAGAAKAAASGAASGALINPISRLLDDCATLEEFRDRLLEAYKDMDEAGIAAALENGLLISKMSGEYDVQKEIRNA